MSYGRNPYYIYEGGDSKIHFILNDGEFTSLSKDALAQFLISMTWRGQHEIDEWIARGLRLRPDLDDFYLTYTKKEKKNDSGK